MVAKKPAFTATGQKGGETSHGLRDLLINRLTLAEYQARRFAAMHSAHLSALEAKHAQLDRRINSESQRPLPDPMTLAALKKAKLRLKEEISIG